MGVFLPCARGCLRFRRLTVDRVVLHTMEGTYAGTIAWFSNPDRPVLTAAHYLVAADGRQCQMALETSKLLHCGSRTESGWNDRSIGIELEGHAVDAAFPVAMLESAAKLVADICRRRGIPVDRTHILGHREVPGVTHTDPGEHFPWELFMDLVLQAYEGS